MEIDRETTIIESLLEDISYSCTRLDGLSDRLDVKLNGNHPIAESIGKNEISNGIIDKLQKIKNSLCKTEKTLEEQINKM